ncbi:MAG TPA: superoxide dismutase family protein [Clostridiales bacterium]|nr:superoxide dismutase family protein [Clostridiales bacterium]
MPENSGFSPRRTNSALAIIRGIPDYPRLRGTVQFRQTTGGVLVNAVISGLPQSSAGFFAFHLHEGTCGRRPGPALPNADYFPDTGAHYNPGNIPHPQHAGDFPPLLRLRDGSARLSFITDRFRLEQVIGRSVVIHMNPDDFKTQPSGDSGTKIACGDILPQNPAPY